MTIDKVNQVTFDRSVVPNKLMSYEEWMKLTYGGPTSRRSSNLKKVDAALKQYHEKPFKDIKPVRQALNVWIKAKGNNWKASIRNKLNAVDTLFKQVNGEAGAGEMDQQALTILKNETQTTLKLLFNGAQVTWKNEFKGKLNSNLVKPNHKDFAPKVLGRQIKTSAATNKFGLLLNSASATNNIHTLATGKTIPQVIKKSAGDNLSGFSDNIGGFIDKIISIEVPDELKAEVIKAANELVSNWRVEITANIMPYSGIIIAGGSAIYNAINAARKQYDIHKINVHKERCLAGLSATQAIDAMITIFERERNADLFSASVSTMEFGGKLAGILIDAGTATNAAIGLSANVCKLSNIFRIICRDVKEKNAANKLLKEEFTLEVFETCPLVGCYLICCAPTSVMMSLFIERFGQAGWMDLVQRNSGKHLEPLREKARKVIKDHRFEIASLANFHGLVEINQNKVEAMRNKKGTYKGIGNA